MVGLCQRMSSPSALTSVRVGFCILAMILMTAGVQPLRADSFTLKDGAVIEGAVIQATKSSIAIKRAIGGLQLVRLSNIEEVRIDRPGRPSVAGRLIGWTEGVHVVDVGDKIIEMRNGEILSEMPSLPTDILIADGNEAQSFSQRRSEKEQTLAATIEHDDQADRMAPHLAASPTSLEPTSQPEPGADLTPAVAPAKVEAAVDAPPGAEDDVMISVSAASAQEGESILFDLRLSQPLARPLVIAYATISGTAKESADFEAQRGIITFEPGDTAAEVRTTLIDDDVAEGEERFGLFLSVDPALATLSERQVTAIIMDND